MLQFSLQEELLLNEEVLHFTLQEELLLNEELLLDEELGVVDK